MDKLLVATRNSGKVREIQSMMPDVNILSLLDYPDMPEIIEDGDSFAANASKKARVIARHTGQWVMGEDSGLEVEALDNRPGIYSARYAGEKATDADNNRKLLNELNGIPMAGRKARYRCFMALANAQGVVEVVNGSCEGYIAFEPKGTNGFGYDPLFFLPEYLQTFGELDPAIKSGISHRARALTQFKTLLDKYARSA